MGVIRLNGVTCIEESTSGWSSNRRRLRRKRFSDEFALLFHVAALDSRRAYLPDQAFTTSRFAKPVDSARSYAFAEPLRYDFSSTDVAFVEVRIQGLEIDGVGETGAQAEAALRKWQASLFFAPVGPSTTGWHSFGRPHYAGNDHDVLFEDFWFFDNNNPLGGGQEPAGVLQPGEGVSTRRVPEYLNEQGIERTVNQAPHEDLTYEQRRYRNSSERSDYQLGFYYR